MLEVEIDVFSGMPNPTFLLSESEEQELLDRIVADPSQLSPVLRPTENLRLGYGGIVLRLIKTDTGKWSTAERANKPAIDSELVAPPGKYPVEFRIATRPAKGDLAPAKGNSAEDWLLKIAERKQLGITDEVWKDIQQGIRPLPDLAKSSERPPEFDLKRPAGEGGSPKGADWLGCTSPIYSANHEWFNRPESVGRNNCYCFASNHIANVRYALPGRRGGRPARQATCGNVIDGLRADGWADGCQTNTLTIALVIWPNEDFHFYRVVSGAPDWWWEHKRGATLARWTDESDRPLHNGLSPVNCERLNYTDFCGYFYQNSKTAFVA